VARQGKDESKPALAKRDKRMLGVIALTALITFLGGLALAGYAAINYKYERAQTGASDQIAFTVPKGAGLSKISQELEKKEFIESAFLFKAVTKLRGNEANFKAGEFYLTQNMSMAAVYDTLANGKAILYPFTAAEGLTSSMILQKETGVGMERGMVAGVFTNRLRKGMKLQSDPTIIYGITHERGLR